MLGLYDVRQRDYSSTIGRFTGTDPMAAKAGTAFAQTYHYALNSPTVLTDPSGACAVLCTALVGLVAGAVIGGVGATINGTDVWQGIGTGALIGGISGLTLGAGGMAAAAAFGGSRIASVAVGAYFGAIGSGIGNAAAGAYYTARSGGTPTWRQAGRDFVSGFGWGAVGTGVGGAALLAARAAAAAIAKAAAARAWLARQNPGPKPADLNDIKCGTKESQPGTLPTVSSSVDDLLRPGGSLLGTAGSSSSIREMTGGVAEARALFEQLARGGEVVAKTDILERVLLPNGGFVQLRTYMSRSPQTAATIDVNIPGSGVSKIKFNP